jgi:hypothetical protein
VRAARAGATPVIGSRSTDPARVDALALGDGTMLVANATDAEQVVEVMDRSITVAPCSVARLAIPRKEES